MVTLTFVPVLPVPEDVFDVTVPEGTPLVDVGVVTSGTGAMGGGTWYEGGLV